MTEGQAVLAAENSRLREELAALAAERAKFRALFEHSSDANLILGAEGILDCNAAAIAMLRADSKDQVLRVHPAVLSPEVQPDGRRSLEKSVEMDRTAYERGYHRFEWTHRRMTGEDFPVEVTLTPVGLPEGRALLVVWHELTEIQRREAELAAQIGVIARQRAEIVRLSLRVLTVWDGVVMIPVLGALDRDSVALLMDAALRAVAEARAHALILDLTGLAGVDAETARHIGRVVAAVRLVGAEGLLVGIGPAVARALVAADAVLPGVRVLASLRDAVEAVVRGEVRSGRRG